MCFRFFDISSSNCGTKKIFFFVKRISHVKRTNGIVHSSHISPDLKKNRNWVDITHSPCLRKWIHPLDRFRWDHPLDHEITNDPMEYRPIIISGICQCRQIVACTGCMSIVQLDNKRSLYVCVCVCENGIGNKTHPNRKSVSQARKSEYEFEASISTNLSLQYLYRIEHASTLSNWGACRCHSIGDLGGNGR